MKLTELSNVNLLKPNGFFEHNQVSRQVKDVQQMLKGVVSSSYYAQ
jgi:hypothetical protein